jgi:hypothetical protein
MAEGVGSAAERTPPDEMALQTCDNHFQMFSPVPHGEILRIAGYSFILPHVYYDVPPIIYHRPP